MLLTGSFRRSLDEKRRFPLPKQLRDALGTPEGGHMYITPGTDRSLALYTEEGLRELGRKLERMPPGARDVRIYMRLLYAQTQRVDVDRQGRIRVPSELATLASLGSEIMLLGVRDHLELWNVELWEAFVAESQADFDLLSERALGASDASPSA